MGNGKAQLTLNWGIWGKSHGLGSPYPLLAHLVDTAAAAYTLLSSHLPSNTLRTLGIDRDDELSIRRLSAIAGLHDLGKASPGFQRKDADQADALAGNGFGFPAGSPIRHEHCTQLSFIEATGLDATQLGSPLSGLLGTSCMLGGHHGTFHQLSKYELLQQQRKQLTVLNPGLGGERWVDERSMLLGVLLNAVGGTELEKGPSGGQLVVGAGLVVLADWIASQSTIVGTSADWPVWDSVDWPSWFASKAELCSEAVRRAGVGGTRMRNLGFEASFGFAPRPLQASLERHLGSSPGGGGVLIVTAPMGVGKTEAALRASRLLGQEDSGLLFLLPTMATTDAIFERVTTYARRVSADSDVVVGLVHSMASLNEAYTDLPDERIDPISDDPETRAVAAGWLRGRQRTLLAPVAAATIDQLLAASLRSRRGFLRWLGLSGKTVIIDEAHSLDAYMHGLLDTALRWLGAFGVPVIVMSATLPARISTSLASAWCEGAGISAPETQCPYPGWLHVSTEGTVSAEQVESPVVDLTVRRIDVPDWATNWTRVVQDRVAVVEDGGAVLVVCNTVKDAQALTNTLVPWATENNVDLRCLHARFPQHERRTITAGITSSFGPNGSPRPSRSVVVGTQIVEQSLDVDFDLVISCAAPVAQLLQRAGRCHRHQRVRPQRLATPALEVLVPVNANGAFYPPPSWSSIYPTVYLQRTVEFCLEAGDSGTWHIPRDVQRLVDLVYGTLADIESAAPGDPLVREVDREWAQHQLNLGGRIPSPPNLTQLSELTTPVDDSLMLATRLGIDTVLVVCAWQTLNGPSLDRAGSTAMPEPNTPADTRALIGATVPLRSSRATDEVTRNAAIRPDSWSDSPWLADAGLLLFSPDTATARTENWTYRLDPLTGLTQERSA